MASESSSLSQQQQITHASHVHFECDDGGIQGSHNQLNINQQVIAYCLIWGLNVDIGNIIFSDLVAKLLNGKKVRVPSACYSVQSTTNKKSKKKKNPASFKPKTSKIVREALPTTQVTDTQHAKETVATSDATMSVYASESTEDLRNQTKLADAEKVQEQIHEEIKEDFGIKSLRNGIGSLLADKELTKADSDLESMPDDENESIYGFEAAADDDDEDAHSEHNVEL
ncbi:hypothetical protein Tco_0480767 [Tanacetum coccineum]